MSIHSFILSLIAGFCVFMTCFSHNAFATDEPDTGQEKRPAKYLKKRDLEKRVMDEFPLVKKTKPVWKLVNGDTDLYVKNLRADRKNKGLAYTTNYIPFMGYMDGIELKFQAGDENRFSFKSNHIPLVGKIDGFTLKGSVGEDSKISARYTIPLDF